MDYCDSDDEDSYSEDSYSEESDGTPSQYEPSDQGDINIPDSPEHLQGHDINDSESWSDRDQERLDFLHQQAEQINNLLERDTSRYENIIRAVLNGSTLNADDQEFKARHEENFKNKTHA